jgi:WD40 repeat protein
MPIDLIINLLQSLTGSTFLQDKVKRSEHVIRVLKQLGLDPDHPPEDFEGVYNYALVEYGIGKPEVCLQIFREREIRVLFRSVFDGNDPQGWLRSGEALLASSEIGQRVRLANLDPIEELKAFAGAFVAVVRRSQTPKETLMGHQLQKIERTIDRRFEQLAAQVEQGAIVGGNTGGNPLALPSATCRAAALAGQMRDWFEILGYKFESYEVWAIDYFEWVIDIPVRRGRYDRVLVRGINGEAGVKDVRALAASVAGQKADEGWLVTARRISQAARGELETADELAGFTWDELLDQDADFSGYVSWLEAEIEQRGILDRYVPLACVKEEVDSVSHQRLGVSRYGESDGWIEGYVDRWLDDPAKEHLSVLGEFGTGKTWFALHYAALALKKYTKASAAGMVRPRLPIVIPLRDYAKAVSVESLFSEFFFRKHEIPIPGYSAFEQLNRMGKLLLIFDGFDEMAARVDKQQMINNFWELAKVVVPGSKVILTCRTEHFPEARQGRSLLNAELQASTKGLTGETPQFEVLELEKFEDEQIRSVLLLQSSAATVEQVMGNAQLLDLARRPVMTELILEALPDIEAGKPVDMSRVYLYAVRRKMERDIKAERTFTSMADKLYFLCELSWEMLSTDRMSINYREFPDRIRSLFGSAVQEEKDLDHWHYDMMGQTMLIRNADGDYSPAHRSLLEFFVAFKFAAELGALAPDFLDLAQMKSGIDRSLEPRDYTWSEYFGGGAVAPLKGFVTESLEKLRSGFGKEVLSKAVLDLMKSMLLSNNQEKIKEIIKLTYQKTLEEVKYVGGNIATLSININRKSLSDCDLSDTIICGADFLEANLCYTNFTGANLSKSQFPRMFGAIFAIEFSPDGNCFATSGATCLISLWRLNEIQPFLVLEGHSEWVRTLVFSSDSKTLYSGSFDTTIRSWDLETGRCLQIYYGHQNRINSIAISSVSESLISGSDDNTVRIWNRSTGECIQVLEKHTAPVESVVVNNKSKLILSAGSDNIINIWNLLDGEYLRSLTGHTGRVKCIAISRDEEVIASSGFDGTIRLWELNSGNCIRIFKGHTDYRISSIIFTPDQDNIVSSAYDLSIKIWNLNSGECLRTLIGHRDWVRVVKVAPDHQTLISGGDDQSLRFWDINSGEISNTIQGHTNQTRCVSTSPDASLIAIGSEDKGLVRIWKNFNIQNPDLDFKIFSIRAHQSRVNSIAISSDNTIFATGGFDRVAKIWSVESLKCLHTLSGHLSCINSLVFSKNNEYLFTASADGTIRVWNTLTGQCTLILSGHSDWIWTVASHPSSRLIASSGDDRIIRIWDLENGECTKILRGHTNGVKSLVFTPDGRSVISSGWDKTVRIWDIHTGICTQILQDSPLGILGLAVSPEGEKIASAGQDKMIRIWDPYTGNCLHTLQGHRSAVHSIHFVLNGTKILSADFGQTMKIWDSETGDCLQTMQSAGLLSFTNITRVQGLSRNEIATLKALGAMEDKE